MGRFERRGRLGIDVNYRKTSVKPWIVARLLHVYRNAWWIYRTCPRNRDGRRLIIYDDKGRPASSMSGKHDGFKAFA